MLNRWMRYAPIRDRLAQARGPILEVGSGSIGLGEFVSHPFVGCDLGFDRRHFTSHIRPVGASAMHLPFRSDAFDVVVCLDVLEHVPRQDRRAAVAELIRVSRRLVIVAAPMGGVAKGADLLLAAAYAAAGASTPGWLEEHVALAHEFPSTDELESTLGALQARYAVLPGEAAAFHVALTLLEAVGPLQRLTGKLSRRPWNARLWPLLALANRTGSYRRYYCIDKAADAAPA